MQILGYFEYYVSHILLIVRSSDSSVLQYLG